jgi:hypothetical protein
VANYVSALVIAAQLLGVSPIAAKESGKPAKRARPPKWSSDVLDAFFPDARTKLVGRRPNYDKMAAVASSAPGPNAGSPPPVTPAEGGWSKLIDAETIETEIKRLSQGVAKDVTAPAQFKGGDFKDCRRHFSVLAALFAVAAEYDGEIRWKDSAASLREIFARAGRNCKVGTDQTFQEATQRKQDLADLVGGNRPKASGAAVKADWSQVADRSPLMQRMNIAQQDRLQKWLSNKAEFSAHRDDIRHESQLVATIADIIAREGFEYWDDETYAQYARDLKQSASDIAAAVEIENFEQARQAIGNASKACANCHEGYRQ